MAAREIFKWKWKWKLKRYYSSFGIHRILLTDFTGETSFFKSRHLFEFRRCKREFGLTEQSTPIIFLTFFFLTVEMSIKGLILLFQLRKFGIFHFWAKEKSFFFFAEHDLYPLSFGTNGSIGFRIAHWQTVFEKSQKNTKIHPKWKQFQWNRCEVFGCTYEMRFKNKMQDLKP